MQAFLKFGSGGVTATKQKPAGSSSGTGDGKKERKHIPWVEKYRPRTVDDVAHQEEVIAVLKKSLAGSDLPNLLFYGPPGTGKTSTILAAARELFGPELYRSRTLELNASDERGIDVVRDKVKKFSQLSASGKRPDGKPCPPFKIVILDEADSMTEAAQSALRRTMEKETKTTRFCLICNYVSRIIEPITSRCAKFRFKPLGSDIMMDKLKEICDKENIQFQDGVLDALMKTSNGDMRKAITTLQSAFRLKGDNSISEEDVYEIAGVLPEELVDRVLKACRSDSYDRLDDSVKEIMREGYSAMLLIVQLHDKVVEAEELTDKQKSIIAEKLAVVDKCLTDGGDEYLQLMDLCLSDHAAVVSLITDYGGICTAKNETFTASIETFTALIGPVL
ncbi:replication factor C subunit 4-like [Liolophura sinensis]|uniref:replication factor C subunit 4-like n=1 Tax=Liolophura sinensis TaxID=3198878 RepID=UPI003158C9B6